MTKLLYQPLSMAAGVAGGLIAAALFKRLWRLIADEDEAPEPTSPEHSWPEVLAAAALQGAIFAAVKAAVDRGGAAGVHRLTGEWPD